ncbi:MAG: hypothetical protein A2Y33_11400 [Spirochaetes bacterium GWF1_51_8]|nr:MAG: hypothetical protein A2Y33_11400 [Spirochaetes bacterium GWF1_51_8]
MRFPIKPSLYITSLLLFPLLLSSQTKDDSVFTKIYSKYKNVVVRLENSQGVGSGFLTSEGFIITADHVVGTSVSAQMNYNGMHFFLHTCYRDHANDIAILYPSGYYIDSEDDYREVPYDFLKGKSKITVGMMEMKADDRIMLMGYPYGIVEVKRILGTYKDEVYRYMENVPLYACDLPVIKGCSGGPVFNNKEEVIGIAVKFETKPTDTDYLISYVSPAKNIAKIMKSIDKEYMKTIEKVNKNIMGFDVTKKNLINPKPKYYAQKNTKTITENGSEFVINKNDTGYYSYSDPGLVSVNVFFDIYLESIVGKKTDATSYVEIYLKWRDEDNYISMVMDMDKNSYYFLYRVDGNNTTQEPMVKMPIVSETKYNFEFYTISNTIGVYFDNIPVFYDHNLPFDTGALGIYFSQMKTMIIQDILLRIPKSF